MKIVGFTSDKGGMGKSCGYRKFDLCDRSHKIG